MLQENIPSVPTERESEKGRVETNNGTPKLEARIPSGPIQEQWDKCRFDMKLVNPANRRKHSIIVVGTGLAGAAAAATLGQQGYHVVARKPAPSWRRATGRWQACGGPCRGNCGARLLARLLRTNRRYLTDWIGGCFKAGLAATPFLRCD